MPNPYSYPALQRRPSDAVEHLASRPPIKKQISRVWSRCRSINRKTQPQTHIPNHSGGSKEDEFEGVLRSGSKRHVFVERGYEVVPRITSTHLAKSRGGLSEVDNMDRKYGSLSSVSTTSRLPYYSHPLSDSTQRRHEVNLPRRPSVIQPKLSRGQIAKFRNASGGSQVSAHDTPRTCDRRQGDCQHRPISGSFSGKPLYPPSSPSDIGRSNVGFGSFSSTYIADTSDVSLDSTPRNKNKKLPLPPIDIDARPRRHLASSRSTAEMKGRSQNTPTSTSSSNRAGPSTNANHEPPSFETSTPRPGAVRYPFVCPDRLVQRHTVTPGGKEFPEKAELTPTFMQPRPAPRPPTPTHPKSGEESSARAHDPTSLARVMSYGSTYPASRTPGPINSETLERLFDEVLQACRAGDIPFSPDSVYSNQDTNSPVEGSSSHYSVKASYRSPGETSGDSLYSPEAITPHVNRDSLPWSPSFEFDTDSDAGHLARSPPVPSTKGVMLKGEVSKRFIPSGRSFEPLRSINVPNTAMLTGPRGDQWQNNTGSIRRGKVREAVAKFESVATGTPPTTPIRVIGEILDRPTLADSRGLSEDSRRMTRMKRLPR